jgi:hypothetical protein
MAVLKRQGHRRWSHPDGDSIRRRAPAVDKPIVAYLINVKVNEMFPSEKLKKQCRNVCFQNAISYSHQL